MHQWWLRGVLMTVGRFAIGLSKLRFLKSIGIQVRDKSVLDVGTRIGENASLMKQWGAQKVVVCDPDNESLQMGLDQGYLSKDTTYSITLQEFTENAHEQFDVVTFFQFCLPAHKEREAFSEALAKSVKSDGLVVIKKLIFLSVFSICSTAIIAF